MEEINSLNNHAIQLLSEKGQYFQSVDLLKKLLGRLKTILSQTTSIKKEQEQELKEHPWQETADQQHRDETTLFCLNEEPLPALPPRQTRHFCNFFFFNKLFKISSRPSSATITTGPDDTSEFSPVLLTACVIYNLAVIHHHLSMMSGSTTTKHKKYYLDKAENLYQMCLKILNQFDAVTPDQKINTSTTSTSTNTLPSSQLARMVHLLRTVSFNNLAEIYLEQGSDPRDEEGKANICLRHLHGLMSMAFWDEDQDNQINLNLNGYDYYGIISNILLLIQLPNTAAAAA